MFSGHLEIPALPVLIPLGIAVTVAAVVVLHWRARLTPGRLGAAWFGGFYALAVLGATMLPLEIAWGPQAGPPELYRFLLVPFVTMRPDDFVLNVAMLLPLAVVLRLVFGVRESRRVVLVGFLISLSIETAQGLMLVFLHGDRWADTNDLIANTLGAWLGFLLLQRALRLPDIRRAVARWTIAGPRTDHPEPAARS